MAILKITSDGDPFPARAGFAEASVSNATDDYGVDDVINDGNLRSFKDSRPGFDQIMEKSVEYSIVYRGGMRDSYDIPSGHNIPTDSPIGVALNGAVIYSPTSNNKRAGLNDFSVRASGNSYNWEIGSPTLNPFLDRAGGRPEDDGDYRYRNGNFAYKGFWNPSDSRTNERFKVSSSYINDTSFGGDHIRHPSIQHDGKTFTAGHSKILGWAFDGFPIYGPFGYEQPLNPESDVVLMRSTYTKINNSDLHYNDPSRPGFALSGTLVEDYEVNLNVANSLDQYNGRYCVTPDFREGTYAYFLTFSDPNGTSVPTNPAYPYIIGPQSKQPMTY